ncbi:MAG: hypothetical protein HY718_17860 [Planctomycetes bacterium]|nr:hypothetical protein [Planctomycetota bacterium]
MPRNMTGVIACVVVLEAWFPPRAAAESSHVFGLHFWDWGANVVVMSHRTGWIVESYLGSHTPNVSGIANPLTGESFTLIQRIDWSWEQTVPLNTAPTDQDTFAQQCGSSWARQIKKHCRHYVIGNEMEFFDVTPADFAQAFTKVRNAIKAEQPEAKVIIGHFNNGANMRATIRLLGRDGYDGIADHTGSSVPTGYLDMLDEENARPEVGVYITEWGWVRDTNPNAAQVMRGFYNAIGQSNAGRSRQVYCACWFGYKEGIGWDHFSMEISIIDKPAFAACTALGTSVNSYAANPVVMSSLTADVPDEGNVVSCRWLTNVPARTQLWWRLLGAAAGASTVLDDSLTTVHQVSTMVLNPSTVYEVTPISTADDRGDAGGRRFRVKTGPWPSQASQTGAGQVAVSWTTDWPTDSRVEFGRTPSLGQLVEQPALVSTHEVNLTGLPAGPLYYRISSSEPNPDGLARLYLRAPIRSTWVRMALVGDFDGNRVVDQEDFGHLQACLTGSGIAQDDLACVDARLDSDNDVDQADVGVFLACYSGSGGTPPAECSLF